MNNRVYLIILCLFTSLCVEAKIYSYKLNNNTVFSSIFLYINDIGTFNIVADKEAGHLSEVILISVGNYKRLSNGKLILKDTLYGFNYELIKKGSDYCFQNSDVDFFKQKRFVKYDAYEFDVDSALVKDLSDAIASKKVKDYSLNINRLGNLRGMFKVYCQSINYTLQITDSIFYFKIEDVLFFKGKCYKVKDNVFFYHPESRQLYMMKENSNGLQLLYFPLLFGDLILNKQY